MTEEQAMAARLTAIAERLYADLVDFEDRGHTAAEVVSWLTDRLSAHVETLTQQVADARETVDAQRDGVWQAKVETLDMLVQTLVARSKAAEQQRDAAHAALRDVNSLSLRASDPRMGIHEVEVQRRRQRDGRSLYVVKSLSDVLNKSGEWEYESIPSDRDDEFIARTRFATMDEAITAGRAALAASAPQKEEKQ
jgi:uncharacterized protein YycO